MSEKHNTESFAIVLNKNGGIKEEKKFNSITSNEDTIWINIDYKDENASNLLLKQMEVDSYIVNLLLSTNPIQKNSINETDKGSFLLIRGLKDDDFNGQNDMISLRVWIDKNIIITSSHRKSPAVEYVLDRLKKGYGPKNIIDVFTSISQFSFRNISNTTYKIIEKIDAFEEKIIKNKDITKFNNKISNMRRQIITLHRYLLPQKEAFKTLITNHPEFSKSIYKEIFRDLSNDINRSIDNLEYSREHIIILKEELENIVNIGINNNMYILSIIVAVFTPLTLISGILGMNLKGIPYSESEYAFPVVCGIMILVAISLLLVIKKKKFI